MSDYLHYVEKPCRSIQQVLFRGAVKWSMIAWGDGGFSRESAILHMGDDDQRAHRGLQRIMLVYTFTGFSTKYSGLNIFPMS